MRFDCQFAWHFSHRHESFSVGFEGRIKMPQSGLEKSFRNTRQGGSERKVLVAKVAVKLKFQSPN